MRFRHRADFSGYDGSTIGFGAYMLCYVRVGFWSDSVGDGSESVPYLRDGRSHDVAKSIFRGRRVFLETSCQNNN